MRTTNDAALVLSVLIAMSGCAAPPNTPGAGVGKAYTPVIDTEGADTSRYSKDLDACRKYAGVVDEQAAVIGGAVGGAILGAAISAMVGGNSNTTMRTANVGAFSGLSSAGAAATAKQERIMINCMAGRGYRTLDGAPIAPVAYMPAPVQPAAFAPVATPSMPNAAASIVPETARADLSPADRIALGVALPQTNTSAAPAERTGQWSYQVERLPEVKVCNAVPAAKMTGKGPGMESYTVACSNGDFLSARCEFGNCRVLK